MMMVEPSCENAQPKGQNLVSTSVVAPSICECRRAALTEVGAIHIKGTIFQTLLKNYQLQINSQMDSYS